MQYVPESFFRIIRHSAEFQALTGPVNEFMNIPASENSGKVSENEH
jgi:hypothetical protein